MSYGGAGRPIATGFSGTAWLEAELLFLDHNRGMGARRAADALGRSVDEVYSKMRSMRRFEKYRQMREGYPWRRK